MNRTIIYKKFLNKAGSGDDKRVANFIPLSKNFRVYEFSCSCSDCGEVEIAMLLPHGCQMIRNIVDEPIVVASGFRCPEHNEKLMKKNKFAVKGSKHLEGIAADIRTVNGENMEAVYDAALKVPYLHGLGRYEDKEGKLLWIHIDFRDTKTRVKWKKIVG